MRPAYAGRWPACAQTFRAPFEVIVLDFARSATIQHCSREYSDQLAISYISASRNQQGWLAEDAWYQCMNACAAPRVLLLDAHCVPDTNVLTVHAQRLDEQVAIFSPLRIYPNNKFYPFMPPIDYDAFKLHSVHDDRLAMLAKHSNSLAGGDFASGCISLPWRGLAEVLHVAESLLQTGAGSFAQQIRLKRQPVRFLGETAWVTWLAT